MTCVRYAFSQYFVIFACVYYAFERQNGDYMGKSYRKIAVSQNVLVGFSKSDMFLNAPGIILRLPLKASENIK